MLNYFRLFFDLCLFRQPAANVPKSDTLLLVTAGTAIISGAINAVPDYRVSGALLVSTIQVLFFALIIGVTTILTKHGGLEELHAMHGEKIITIF